MNNQLHYFRGIHAFEIIKKNNNSLFDLGFDPTVIFRDPFLSGQYWIVK